MKKTLAVLLSVLMVISTITCMFTVTTAQAEALSGELIQNGDFENLTLNPVGENTGAVRGTKDLSTLLNGKWLRATGGLSYATYGDLTDYNAETDEVTKATATDYAKYFTACTTVIAQPDNQANHIGRANQTLFQGIRFNADEETFVYKMKVRGNDATTKFTIGFEGLQTTDGATPIDSFYDKYNLEVVKQLGNFTTAKSGGKIYVTLTNPNEWTDVEIIFKATKVVDAVPTNAQYSILDIDFTMFHLYHDSATLSSGDNGKNYRKNGMYYDDISLKAYVNPFGKGEFYKDGKKLENTNEYGGAKYTVNGEKALGIGLGDTVVATPDYNEDANVFVGWYKNNELVTREKEISFTVNSTDVYTPKFINKNLLEKSASFETYLKGNDLVVDDATKFPENEEWGSTKVAGYYGATYNETIYDVNGNAYMQEATGSAESLDTNAAKIDNTYVKTGNYSLLVGCNYRTPVMGLDVTPNTNYTLTYYVTGKDTDDIKLKTGIVSAVNISRNATPTPAEDNTNPLPGMTKQTISDLNGAFTLVSATNKVLTTGNWEKITLKFNSGNFEKLYLAVSPYTGEKFWIDDLALVAEETEAANVAVKYVDTDGVALDAAKTANVYAKTTVTDDFDGSSLLSVDYEKESGAYTFLGWYDADNNLLSKDEIYDYEGDLADVYAKIISRNDLEKDASYEGYANGTSLFTTDMTRYPNEGEWGESTTTGYFKATVEEVIYDKYGYAYQQTKNGERAKYGASAKITNQKAYKGSNSLLLTGSYATTLTAFDVEPHTNYTVTFYALTNDASQKMKYSGITTTVNVAYNLVPTALDGGTLASSMSVALGNMGDAYALSKHSALTMSDTEWTKVTHTFNSGSFNKVYFCVCPSASEKYYIDELSLVAEEKAETVDVKLVDANGDAVAEDVAANAIVSATVQKDIYTGTKTASVNYETGAYTFLGWYNAEGELVSSTKEFIVTGSLEGVYAKVQNNNLLTSAASYESYANNTSLKYTGTDYPSGIYFGGNKNDGYLGMTFEETIYDNKGNEIQQTAGGTLSSNSVTANVSNKYAHSGYNSVYIKNSFWTASMGIDVKPNTDYVLSYYILAPAYTDANNVMALSAIATTVNTGAMGTGATASLNSATTLYLASKTITSLHDGKNWVKVTHSFNSMNLSKVYLVLGQTAVGKNPSAESYIDDLTLIETTPTTMDVEMKNCASIDPVDASLDALYIGQEFTFKVIDNMDTDAIVTFNGEAVTANVDGTYTVVLAEENALSVRFAGDENLPNYDEDEFGRKLNVNNLDVYSEPIWNGDTVYHETALFTPDKDTVKLLYPVDEIVSLRSYDLMTNYIEGYDFEITEDGMIKRLEGGRIPVWATSLTTDTPNDWPTTDGKYVVLTGDQTYPKFAISVTYKHSTTFADGYQPSAPDTMKAAINNTLNKLAKGEEVNIVIYGDSISCGWSSSGMTPDIKIYDETNTEGNYITRYNINVAPYAPTWVQMLEARLKELYPDATINFKNLSLGGKSSPWGAENIAARLALWKDEEGNQVVPDLMLIGFGVNDSAAGTNGIAVDEFKANMKAIVDNAREFTDNMNMEALYYSPMFPNQSSTEWPAERLLAYEAALEDLYLNDDNIGIVKLSSIFNEIIKSKNCEDYLNTNLNHGNDFTARLYYTSIMQAMTKPEDDLITPDAPAAPVAEKVTANSVTLVATEGYEYSKDGYCWQDSNVFEGLEANTEYTFYQRIASTDEAYTSEISKALTVTTPDAWVGIMGDANGDGTVNLKDLVTLARFVANWEGIEESPAMDLDGDGEIDLDDVTYLSKYLAGWPDYTI